MSRGTRKGKTKKTIQEQITELDLQIGQAEAELEKMYEQKSALMAMQEEEDMKGLLQLMKDQKLSLSDVAEFIQECQKRKKAAS